MKTLRDLDMVQHAEAAVRSIMQNYPHITREQAQGVIRVEVTQGGFHELAAAADLSGEVFRDEPHSPLRRAARAGYGSFQVMGIDYYLVPELADGDTWRVRNALGTR